MDFRLSIREDILDLKKIWKLCFNEGMDAIDYFFENRYAENICVVCEYEGTVVSALYMFDACIYNHEKYIPAYYLYAAGTLPQYRNKGIMKKLISFANELQRKERGTVFSILLPASDDLYTYYESLGYKTFFKNRVLSLSSNDIEKYGKFTSEQESDLDAARIYEIRKKECQKMNGSLIWDKKAIDYAISINKIYKSEVICLKDSYALCTQIDKGKVLVSEFIADSENYKELLYMIKRKFKALEYIIRIPCSSNILSDMGSIERFGMIKLLKEECRDMLLDNEKAYLGLALD